MLQEHVLQVRFVDVFGYGFPGVGKVYRQLLWPQVCNSVQALHFVSAFDLDWKGWLISVNALA